MNANIKEYIRLCSIPEVQKKIRERMGEWQIGDMCVVLDELALVYGIIPATSRQGRRIYIRFLDRQDFDSKVPNPPSVIAQDFDEDANKYYLRLPQAIDLQDPERGLWGMVDWGRWYICNQDPNEIKITTRYDGPDYKFVEIKSATPEIALIRALMHQWGISE